jgi:serine/threonine-protein kinase
MSDDDTSRMSDADQTGPIAGDTNHLLADRYELRGLIGSGGMADVQLAYDHQLQRHVAIKLLHGRYANDPTFRRRFAREAQNAGALNHPNVVAVYDTGETDGRPFIVMEYVSGRGLDDVIAAERVLPERTAEIIGDAAIALDYAHQQGIIHRDIKPGNILIADDGTVKVTDFGVARAVDAQDATQTATVFGTAAYVAPEQAQGYAVDHRTDIYALGCVLYELLTGQQAFHAETAVALAYQHVSTDPTPPSQLSGDVTAELQAVVLRAMAKQPDERHTAAGELNVDLQRAVSGLPVTPPARFAADEHTPPPGGFTQPLPDADHYAIVEEPDEPPRKGRAGAYVVLIVLILIALGAAAVLAIDVLQTGLAETEEIPDLRGVGLAQAQSQLARIGFETDVGPQEQDPELEPNRVVRTEPPTGTDHELRAEVTLIPSAGPAMVTVPDVSGEAERDARETLTDAELEAGKSSQQASEDVDEGDVIRTDPSAGARVRQGSTVELAVSSGEPLVRVPDVIDRTKSDACDRVREADLRCQSIRAFSDSVDKGRVSDQSPDPGSRVATGETVTLTISRGPAEPDDGEDPDQDEDSQDGANGLLPLP